MTTSSLVIYFLLFFFLATVASVSSADCSYIILVKTGTLPNSGTNSKISAILADAKGSQVNISNLEQYGKMGSGYNYYEDGNLDTFIIQTTCLGSPVCFITLKSDNTGSNGWNVEFVEVLTTNCASAVNDNILFETNTWISASRPPYALSQGWNWCPRKINSII